MTTLDPTPGVAVGPEAGHQPPPTLTGPPPPPSRHERARTNLDHLEWILIRVILVTLALLVVAVGLAVVLNRRAPAAAAPGAAAPTTPDVRPLVDLRVVFADGSQVRYGALPYAPDMTVMDALHGAERLGHDAGSLRVVVSPGGMVTGINGAANQGAGADRRNWLFWINDAPATEGAATARLKPGDRVVWAFLPGSADAATPP